MKNLTAVAFAPRGFRWRKGDADYNFVRAIVDSKRRQFSYELMANDDVMKVAAGGNFLFGLAVGDKFLIEGTKRDLIELNRKIKSHKSHLYLTVETKVVNCTLYGECY